MWIGEHTLKSKQRDTQWRIYALGDLHIGALNCAEDKIRAIVDKIAKDPNARWFGGGDMMDLVILNDAKRFDVSILPDWMVEGLPAEQVKASLSDMVGAQVERLKDILAPIKNKCLGLIEGNHEYNIKKYHNRDVMPHLCDYFDAPNLTDCAYVRLNFKCGVAQSSIRVFITHGHGGGRTSGAEPNSLYRLAADKECEVILKGHSHTFCIHPPIPMLTIPKGGKLGQELSTYDKFAGNWGAFVYTYQQGPSTYASRANYPVRPMYTLEVVIAPFTKGEPDAPAVVEMLPVRL